MICIIKNAISFPALTQSIVLLSSLWIHIETSMQQSAHIQNIITEISIFHYSNLIPGGALHALGEPIDYKGEFFDPVFKQPIIAFRLDDFITLFSLPTPNHIKIDVDGIEFKILRGSQQTLCGPMLRSLMVEIDEANSETPKMIKFLRDQGFAIHSKHRYVEGGHAGPASRLFNYLFQKK